MKRLRLGLRYKFIFTLAGFTLLVAIPLGVLSVMRFADGLESQFRIKWKATAEAWADQLSRELRSGFNLADSCNWWFSKWSQEVIYMRVQLADPVKLQCAVYEERTLTPAARAHFLAPSEAQLSQPDQLVRFVRGADFLDLTYSTWVLIRLGDDLLRVPAYVRLGIHLANVQAQVRREAAMVTMVVLGYIVLGLLIAFAFSKMILGPAEGLAEALKRFQSDSAARAHITTGDELETLAQEFNAMADAIEERKRQLEEINAALVKANRAKSDFLAMMSHELKTPLHAIRGYSQLLLEGIDGSLTKAQREDLENILNAGDHLLQLIDNILRFSKLEASEDRPYFEAVEASAISEEAVRAVSALARGKNLELTYQIEPCTLIADGTKLKQALINLLSNAIKYTPAGHVALSGAVRGVEYWFSVSDTGVGIPAHERERIFEPFTQLDSSNTRESQGVGLGLAIVKKYIEMHSGRVHLKSEVGRGSVFSLVLPLDPHLAPSPLKGAGWDEGETKEVSHAHPHC